MAVMKLKKKSQSITQIWLKWTQKSNLMAFLSCLQILILGPRIGFFFENHVFFSNLITFSWFYKYRQHRSQLTKLITHDFQLSHRASPPQRLVRFGYGNFVFFFSKRYRSPQGSLPIGTAAFHGNSECVCPIVKSLCINIQFVGQQGWFRLQRRRRPTDWLTDWWGTLFANETLAFERI